MPSLPRVHRRNSRLGQLRRAGGDSVGSDGKTHMASIQCLLANLICSKDHRFVHRRHATAGEFARRQGYRAELCRHGHHRSRNFMRLSSRSSLRGMPISGRADTGIPTVVLSGGVFMNSTLADACGNARRSNHLIFCRCVIRLFRPMMAGTQPRAKLAVAATLLFSDVTQPKRRH